MYFAFSASTFISVRLWHEAKAPMPNVSTVFGMATVTSPVSSKAKSPRYTSPLGSVISVRLISPAKAPLPIYTMLSGKVTDESLESPLNVEASILVRLLPSPKVTAESALHPEKAPPPSAVTDAGISTETSPLPAKASKAISDNLPPSANVTFVMEYVPKNAFPPMLTIFAGISISGRAEQPAKASLEIFVSPAPSLTALNR